LFLTLKGFLLELAGHQEGVGAVLEEGARMLSEGGLSRDEEDEVRVQMRLLNSRWEDLRIKAMERQSRYSPNMMGYLYALCSVCSHPMLSEIMFNLTGCQSRSSHIQNPRYFAV
jgi:hypothetical protein